MTNKIFVSLSNGDYNDETDTDDMELVRWELCEGGQQYVIITRDKITVEQYTKICEILDKRGNYVEKNTK